jgi:hypothetical protein
MLSDKLAGLVSLIFFLAASSADLYEHFLHASANNVFMVAPGDWTPRFRRKCLRPSSARDRGMLAWNFVARRQDKEQQSTQVRRLSGTGANGKTFKYSHAVKVRPHCHPAISTLGQK